MADRDFILLQRQLEEHIEQFETHVADESRRWDDFVAVQLKTANTVEELSSSVQDYVKSTQGLVEAWQAANGAVKVGTALGKFLTWLTKFAIIGAAATWIAHKLERFL